MTTLFSNLEDLKTCKFIKIFFQNYTANNTLPAIIWLRENKNEST